MRFPQIVVFYICPGLRKGFLVRLVPDSLPRLTEISINYPF